jgi:hypothetical protein
MSDQVYIKSIEDDNEKLRARNMELEGIVQKQEEELTFLRPKPMNSRIESFLESHKKAMDSFRVPPYMYYEEEKDEVTKKGILDRVKSMFGMK